MLLLKYAVQISGGFADSDIWDFIGSGSVLGVPIQRHSARRRRPRRSLLAQPDASGLEDHGGRRIAPLGAQFRHFGALDGMRHLRLVGSARRRRRIHVRGAAQQRRRRRRFRHGARGAYRGFARRQQPRRRPRLDRQSADRGDHRPRHYQWRRAAWHSERRRRHAAWTDFAVGRRSRCALAEKPPQGIVESLCIADSQRSAALPGDRGGLRLPLRSQRQTSRRRAHRPWPGRGARGRHLRSRPTISIAAPATAT